MVCLGIIWFRLALRFGAVGAWRVNEEVVTVSFPGIEDGLQNAPGAEYFFAGMIEACKLLGIEVEFMYTHVKYREGFFAAAIEKTLENNDRIRQILHRAT